MELPAAHLLHEGFALQDLVNIPEQQDRDAERLPVALPLPLPPALTSPEVLPTDAGRDEHRLFPVALPLPVFA